MAIDYHKLAAQDAAKYGVPSWFLRQISQESGFNPSARSPAGALGIAQFMPATARSLGVNPLDPVASLDASARLMAGYVKKYGAAGALAAYNAGPGHVSDWQSIPETRRYVSSILGGQGAGAQPPQPTPFQSPGLQPAPFAPTPQPGNVVNQLIGALGQGDTHQRTTALLGAILGMRRGQSAQTFQPLASGQGGQPLGPLRPGVPVAHITSVGGDHPTLGLPGYPAHDFFAPSGSAAISPVAGRVVRLSGNDPSKGPTQGPHGPLGWSVYIQAADGHTYYLTHLGSRSVKVGQTVRPGQPIGTVADYAKYGTPSHIHMGIH